MGLFKVSASHILYYVEHFSTLTLPYKMPLIGYRTRQHSKILMNIANSVRLNTVRTLNAKRPLYCLPVELIDHICQYLPIAETFCLMISCARFWYARTSIRAFLYIRHKLATTAHNSWSLTEARFHILRLMEFDKICGKGTESFCCWACMRTHRKKRNSSFYSPQKPVNLKFSIEEQRINCSDAITRSCKYKRRKIWVGICYEMTFAELRTLVLGMRSCREKVGSSITISAGGCFSEHVEFNLDTMHLLSSFYLGRRSDLDLDDFDRLCLSARIPMCPHHNIGVLANRLFRKMHPGQFLYCLFCRSRCHAIITPDGMIEIHISRYVGMLETGLSPIWYKASYTWVDSAFLDHCRAFSDWLDSMYNPETGAVYNGGQFETFAPTPKGRYIFHSVKGYR